MASLPRPSMGIYTEGMGVRRNRTRPGGGLNEGRKLKKSLGTLACEFAKTEHTGGSDSLADYFFDG